MSRSRTSWFALLVTIALFAGPARAQTVTQTAPVWYGPGWVSVTGTAQLVAGSAMAPVGGVVPLPPLVDSSSGLPITTFSLTFPALSTTTIVSGVLVTTQATGGGLAWKPQQFVYPITLTVPAGNSVNLQYSAPISGGSVTIAAVPPPVTADGVKMPPATQLLDAAGALWTVGALCGSDGKAGQVSVYRNGVRQFCSIDFATIKAGVVYVSDFGSGPGWQVWNGSAFVLSPAP